MMKMSKFVAGMSAAALAAAVAAFPAAAIEAPVENLFYAGVNETWTFTYSGADIAAIAGEKIVDPDYSDPIFEGKMVQLVGFSPLDESGKHTGKDVPYYSLGFNIHVGQMKNAKLTVKVTSSANNIYDGEGSTNSGYMYTVESSWYDDAPTDYVKGWRKYDYDFKGDKEMKKGACDLVNWDTGPSNYNGTWAAISLTDDNVSALTFEVTITSDENTKWKYYDYDPQKSDDENTYSIFYMAGGTATPTSCTNKAYCITQERDTDYYAQAAVVPTDFINSRIPGGVTSDKFGKPNTSSKPDNSSKPDGSNKPGTPGDVNGDGELNVKDVIRMQKSINDGSASSAFDVNGDKEVNIKDVIRLQKFLNGDPVKIV